MGRSRSRSPRRRSRSRSRERERDRDRGGYRDGSRDGYGRSRGDREDYGRRDKRERSPDDRERERAAEDRAKRARLDAEYARRKRMEVLKEIRGDAHVEDEEEEEIQLTYKAGENGLVSLEDDVDEDEEAKMMKKLMGITGFDTTKEKPVESNHQTAAKGAVRKGAVRTYRQYMNRRGGFNRPLDKVK